ncbi:MAG: TolC family protein, partial [Prevotellaceae bacterium]|nr:TolC family protein [Prevotellaceae bacterium]
MTTKKGIVTMLFISAMMQLSGQDARTSLSLKQSCRLGIEQNVNVRNAALEQQKARYRLKEAQSNLYPQVEASANLAYTKLLFPAEMLGQKMEMGPDYNWSGSFSLTQLLYSQSYFTSLKLARRMETLGELNLQQKKEEVIFQVSQLYYLCQATNEQILQLQAALKNMESLLGIAKLQNEQGVIRKADYWRISVGKNNLQTQADNLNQLYVQQLGMLKHLIGLPVETEVALSDSLAFSPAGILQKNPDLTNRTELQLLDKKIEMTGLSRKMNRQAYLPTLAGFGIYLQGQREEFEPFKGDKFFRIGAAGIRLTLPVFDGFEKHSKTKQYDLELKQLEHTRGNT